MRRFLLALALLLSGCGSVTGAVSGTATVDTPAGPVSVSFDLPVGGLRGGLPTALVLADFADVACPISETQAANLLQQLDAWVTRQSTGRAWVAGRVVRVTLPGTAVDYTAQLDHGDAAMSAPVQGACRALGLPEAYQVYLLPGHVREYTGWGQRDHKRGWAWLGESVGDSLPLAHEFGHVLGLEHGGGVMHPSDPAAATWSANFDAQALSALGWLSSR